jgi:PAS domain S-box-containing protein
MPPSFSSDALLVIIALAGQATVAVLTSLMLWGFRRRYKHEFSSYWALGWAAAAWHYTCQTMAYAAAGLPASGPSRLALTWASQTAGYWQCILFVVAAVSMVRNRKLMHAHRLRRLLLAVPFVALALTLAFAFDPSAAAARYTLRFVVQSLIFGVSCLSAAVVVAAARRDASDDVPVAHRALVGALAGLGIVELSYAAPFFWQIVTGTALEVTPLFGLLEMAFLLALSMAMNAWFLERDRSAAVEHRTRLEAATAALRRRDEQFRAIMECAPYGILLKDLEGHIVMANDSAAALLGLPGQQALHGRRTSQLFNAEIDAQLRAADVAAVELGECEAEFAHVGPTGDTRTINTQRFPIRNDAHVPVGLCITMTDVTERRQNEAHYHQSQKLESIGRLAGGVAHDFNNLLTAILAHVEFAEQGKTLNDEVREDLGQIRVAAQRAAGLTAQLLAFARRQAIEPQAIDLSRHVTGMGHMLRRLIGETIECSIDVADDAWLVRADHGQIEQAIVNLVLNARDAMPSGGKLSICTHNIHVDEHGALAHRGLQPGDYHAIQVSDTGTGMTEQVKSRIFEPFFTTKSAGRGTGLGLATVYGIIAQSGGRILVDTAPDVGTTFSIYLPRVRDDEPLASPSQQEAVEYGGQGELVLVVEDEADVRDVVARTLAAAGYRVLTADNGETALTCANDQGSEIAVLVSDVVMPRIGGVDLVRRLSVSHPEMRVLLTTGYSGEGLGTASFIDERRDVLTKPFTPGDLLRRVGQVLETDSADAPTAARITLEFEAITGAA